MEIGDARSHALLIDIGGTNTRLAPVAKGGVLGPIAVFPTASHASLLKLLREKFDEAARGRVFLGIAGPVAERKFKLTNSPFAIDKSEIEASFPALEFHYLNDVESLAYGLIDADKGQMTALRQGRGVNGDRRLVIAPGTGLGAAFVMPGRPGPIVVASEFGQVTLGQPEPALTPFFAAATKALGRLSIEMLVSGPGLQNIYATLSVMAGAPAAFEDAPSAIKIEQAARAGRDKVAIDALRVFSQLLGSVCGDGALAYKATGGVFLAGSLVNALKDILSTGEFGRAFAAKGPMSDFVRDIPVSILEDREPVLSGLLAYAARASR